MSLAVPMAPEAMAAPRAAERGFAGRPEVEAFVERMATEFGFGRRELRRLLTQARADERVVRAMSAPLVEPPKWHEYAPRFLNPERIEGGVRFWSENAEALAAAERQWGVPPAIVVAVIGVETLYGRVVGGFRVLDALSTLAFDYPRRAEYFKEELAQFLLLAREQSLPPLELKGSFAGAMGVPQFMPGSFRRYAVDLDGDGRIDIWRGMADSIGSVANYLSRHGWERGGPVLLPVAGVGDAALARLDGGLSAPRALSLWRGEGLILAAGAEAEVRAAAGQPDPDASLVMLEEAGGPGYRLAFNNFRVITRYNRSRLYATAVWELAQAVASARLEAR